MPARKFQNSTPPIWGLTNKQICQNWNQLFQSNRKTNGFKDKWIVHYREEHPSEADGWDGKEKQYLEITFKCREVKCSNVWTVSRDKGFVIFFFRRNPQEDPHKGELLIWLDHQPCPICQSGEIPEMSVDGSEMNAVLTYLKIKIGRLYYGIDYPKDAEEQIEKSRKKKTAVPKIKEMAKNHDNSNNSNLASPTASSSVPNSAKITARSKSYRGENKENINHGIQVGNKPNFPAARSAVKPKQKKQKNLKNKTAPSVNAGPSHQSELDNVLIEWQPIFEEIFGKLITENGPNDKWTFDFGIFGKEERQNKANRFYRFLDYNVGVKYYCSMCPNKWSSYLPKISFRILQNNRIDGKPRGGHVTIAIKSGQECKFCHLRQDKKYYEKGRLKKGEIERILIQVLMRIEYFFYGKQLIRGVKKSLNRKPRPHQSELCENCANGDCEEVSLNIASDD